MASWEWEPAERVWWRGFGVGLLVANVAWVVVALLTVFLH
jgi:hypothetical protein